MNAHSDNQSWVVNRGGLVIEKKAKSGPGSLNDWERLLYCLWVVDYMMRNAGDLANAADMYPNWQTDAKRLATGLSLPGTKEVFSLSKKKLQAEYFDRFEAVCSEIKNAEPSEGHGEPVFMFSADASMRKANEQAQATFKYFWREISWERRRIIPAFDMMLIKLPFTDNDPSNETKQAEHMWVDGVEFDGEKLSGVLMNSPNWLKSVKQGDPVSATFPQLADWMIMSDGKAYGAFTVNAMRAKMSKDERKEHDAAWGLDFGEPEENRINPCEEPTEKPGLLRKLFGGKKADPAPVDAPAEHQDHVMCVNMLPKIEEALQKDASPYLQADENGWTMLHHEALAGNFGVAKLLVKYGADVKAKTNQGKDAIDLAKMLKWEEIADYLQNGTR